MLGSREWCILSAVHCRIENRLDIIDNKLKDLPEEFKTIIESGLTISVIVGDEDTEATGTGTQNDPIVIE